MSLKDFAQAVLTDQLGQNDVSAEVNFDENYPDTVRLMIAGKEAVVSFKELYSLVFSIVNSDQQVDLIPVRKRLGRVYVRQHQVQLKKDMKAGETLSVNCNIFVDQLEEEAAKNPPVDGGVQYNN